MQPSLFDVPSAGQARSFTESEVAVAKERHPGMVLLFRVGDHFALFEEDAILGAELLGLTLVTSMARPSTSFPRALLEAHLRKLLHSGYRVAVCDSEENQA